jgi:hypothetical protein
VLAGEGSEDLTTPALAQLLSDVLDEFAFLRVELVFRKIGCRGDQERHQTFDLWIEALAPDLSDFRKDDPDRALGGAA